jgi:hypothetical protein
MYFAAMKRRLLWIAILGLLGGAGWLGYQYWKATGIDADAFSMVPSDAVFIVETDEPVEAWRTFSASNMWQHLKGFPPLGDIGKLADGLDAIIADNATLFSVFGKRNLIISAHMTAAKDYDFLYIADMQQGAKLEPVKTGIVSLLKQGGFRYSEEKAGEHTLHGFYNANDKSTLTLCFVANRLLCSYTKGIIEKSLAEYAEPKLKNNVHFTQVLNETPAGGLCRFFLNYERLPAYLAAYMEPGSIPRELLSSMYFSGTHADFEGDRIDFEGRTNINDSISTYLSALSRSGSAETEAEKVLSKHTAFMLSMGFSDFAAFYSNLRQVMDQDAESAEQFTASQKTVERLLNIRINDHILSWIGKEVTMAEYRQDRVIGGKIHKVIAIRPRTMELAKSNLDHIEKMIRKRTPLKFKNYMYKEHEVRYLEAKGLFRLLFGKLFGKIEKPFYTFLGDYVVFSDDPRTLLQTIDDYVNGQTLDKEADFQAFSSTFSKTRSVFAYLNMPRYFSDLRGLLSPAKWQSTKENRAYILCFPQIGLHFKADEAGFRTRFSADFRKPGEQDLIVPEMQPLDADSVESLDSLSDVDQFMIEHINGNVMREYYDNGQLKFIAEVKENIFHGKYLEYWENGTVMVKGKYRDGQKTGRWRYFNAEGVLERRERFGRDKETDPEPLL